jgi:hypothetical protein
VAGVDRFELGGAFFLVAAFVGRAFRAAFCTILGFEGIPFLGIGQAFSGIFVGAFFAALFVAACCKSIFFFVGIGAPETDFWKA